MLFWRLHFFFSSKQRKGTTSAQPLKLANYTLVNLEFKRSQPRLNKKTANIWSENKQDSSPCTVISNILGVYKCIFASILTAPHTLKVVP